MFRFGFGVLVGLSLVLVGCVSAPKYTIKQQPKLVPQKPKNVSSFCRKPSYSFVGGVGDELFFSLLEAPAYHRMTLKIHPSGSLSVPLIGQVRAVGRPLEALRSEIQERLSHYYRKPHVLLQWSRIVSSTVTVVGLVNKPGSLVLQKPLRLSRALALVGGLRRELSGPYSGNVVAELSYAFIRRPGEGIITPDFAALFRGRVDQDIWLLPGDTVVIPQKRRHSYMALGEFTRPHRFVKSGSVRILDIVAQGGGLKPTSSGQLLVLRGSLSRHRVWRIQYQDIVHGKVPNFLLKPNDIVYAPPSGLVQFDRVIKRILPLVSVLLDSFRTFSGVGLVPVGGSSVTQ